MTFRIITGTALVKPGGWSRSVTLGMLRIEKQGLLTPWREREWLESATPIPATPSTANVYVWAGLQSSVHRLKRDGPVLALLCNIDELI